MVSKELWVQNPGTSDVSISDLGLKVPAGKTVNLYAVNPYLTEDQVSRSLKSGALEKRLNEHGVLKLVTKKPKENLSAIKKIREDSDSTYAKKTKSSVIIETKGVDVVDDDSFDFADYGVDLGEDVSQVRKGKSVFVKQKEDPADTPEPGSPLAPKTSAGPAQRQSSVVMKHQSESQANPVGKVAKTTVTPSDANPFVVSAPPEESQPQAVSEPTEKIDDDTKSRATKQEDGTVAMAGVTKHRNIAEIAGNTDLASPVKDEAKYDAKVATKSDDGAIVMRFKEEAPQTTEKEAEPKVKASPTKKTTKKTTKKASKKSSKKN